MTVTLCITDINAVNLMQAQRRGQVAAIVSAVMDDLGLSEEAE